MRRGYDVVASMARLAEREAKSGHRRRPPLWRKGFLSESAALYNQPLSLYVSDADRWLRTRYFNDEVARNILGDKLVFHTYYDRNGFVDHLPKLVGVRIGSQSWVDTEGALAPGVLPHGDFVAKPVGGNSGAGVLVSADATTMEVRVPHIVQERISNVSEISAIWPDALNTIRVLTIRGSDGEPFVARAVHRFGSSRTPRVDNWSAGGLSAAIDLKNGILGRAAAFPKSGSLVWHDRHPDSGSVIAGTTVPRWREVQDLALRAVRSLPGANWVGWDIAVSPESIVLLEGNDVPDINLLQVHAPLLADSMVQQAYVELVSGYAR
jgi:hypothetical protein